MPLHRCYSSSSSTKFKRRRNHVIFACLCLALTPSLSWSLMSKGLPSKVSTTNQCETSLPSKNSKPFQTDRLRIHELEGTMSLRSSTALYDSSVTSSSNKRRKISNNANDAVQQELDQMKRSVLRSVKDKNFEEAQKQIVNMLAYVKEQQRPLVSNKSKRMTMSIVVDEAIQSFTDRAFAKPFRGKDARKRIRLGLQVLDLQLSSSSSKALVKPYNTVPRSTVIQSLKALTGMMTSNKEERRDYLEKGLTATNASFRMLQRLVSGVGVRYVTNDQETEDSSSSRYIDERDFNMVLNAVSTLGKMDVAHKVVALQERTPHAPPLSAVAYSILLKGYGQLKDLDNVEMTISHARKNGVVPDVVMLNSLINAYVNCNEVDTAYNLFRVIKEDKPNFSSGGDYNAGGGTEYFLQMRKQQQPPDTNTIEQQQQHQQQQPMLNGRTFNTILKGLAQKGAISEALELSNEMKNAQIWDDITTNTLVKVAVSAGKFNVAESILTEQTSSVPPEKWRQNGQHPNVEAYTELLDGYAKAGMLDRALLTMQLMRQRGVEPSIVTYTCMIGALARAQKVDEAKKMLQYMSSNGVRPTLITYNAFISGLVASDGSITNNNNDDDASAKFDGLVNEALRLIGQMLKSKIKPNSVTVSVVVDALGKCSQPRLAEAKALVAKLSKDDEILEGNERVGTALIKTYTAGGDIDGALQAFRGIRKPDVIAINAFLDACCRCGKVKVAFDTFEHYFGLDSWKTSNGSTLRPDVVTYSILLSALLKKNIPGAAKRAQKLYNEMRDVHRIKPDIALVDIILTAMVKGGRLGLQKKDVKFTLNVLRDGEKLDWGPGAFEKRKRAVRAVMIGRMSEVWKTDEDEYGMISTASSATDTEDALFKRKGWNKVDSGFRLWGGGDETQPWLDMSDAPSDKSADAFLASKGWNDVDSGFKII